MSITASHSSGSNIGGVARPTSATSDTGSGLIPPPPPEPSRPRTQKEEDEEAFKELCASNGLNHNKIQSGEQCTAEVVEMFFSGYPRIVYMDKFPCLHTLVLMSQSISKIEGLAALTGLKELWISECQLKKIENLEACTQITKLYLYGNEIPKIENISHLTRLQILYLNNNCIKNIENLEKLKMLEVLNLAENQIDKIGHCLDANQKIKDLNLSGNPISSLRELTHLMRLPELQSLNLKDPQFCPAPVSLLCNYSTHVLYHLPNISKLDTYDVSKNVCELAEATVLKKKMYYNMRVKTIKRNMADVAAKMEIYKSRLLEFPHERLRNLVNCVKEVRREFEDLMLETIDISVFSDLDPDGNLLLVQELEEESKLQKLDENGEFTVKMNSLKDRMKKWERRIAEVESYQQEAVSRIEIQAESVMRRMAIELESGGNVRFEEGITSDVWFSSCHDLVLSRFCATDYREYGIAGIKIHRILRVHNRMLRKRFDDKLTGIVDNTDGEYFPSNRNTTHKKLLEYLFWIWDPNLPGGIHETTRVVEEGFMDSMSYKALGRDGSIPLSNSLSLADRHRVNSLMKESKEKEHKDACPFRYGHLVISKVFLGKSVKAIDDRPIIKSNYPKIDAVFKPRKMCIPPSGGDSLHSCECSARQCEWYLFDNELILPEYIVEYEYVTKFRSKSPFATFTDLSLDNRESKIPSVPHADDDPSLDDDVLGMEPLLKPRPRLTMLNEELLMKHVSVDSLEAITVLNLHNNGISKLKPMQSLSHLRRLTVSFNELCRLDEVASMGLEYLDASFNQISSLDGLKNMVKLKFFDLSWNKLANTREDLSILRKHACNLLTLDLRNNQWLKPQNIRLRVIGRLKSLTLLDGSAVTEHEATAALRVAAGSRICQLSLLTHARVDSHKPRSLSLMPTAEILEKQSHHRPEKLGETDTHWYQKVTSLFLNSQHITKLSGLERLENLKYASFNGNDITKIEGLDHCGRLEELSLDNNCISRLEGISKLTQLRRLCLACNFISTLENSGIHYLGHLTYLSLEGNRLSSLLGLQKMSTLVELYVGNNLICSVREIFYLKMLSNLVILDLFGNPVATETDNYRLFIIYHLKNLKALDGSAIEAMEGNLAKDTFGGRLTPDFVAEKLGHSNFQDVRELDLPNCSIRIVDLGIGDTFLNLRSVNLEHNNLSSFSGLVHLPNIRVLCLNHNHIECIMPKQKPVNKMSKQGSSKSLEFFSNDTSTPIMESLEVLHLGYNGIKDMSILQLSRLTSLKALFLQGNEISKVEGMEGLHDLRELVLDRNKIKVITELSFANQWNLQELHIEENRVRELSYLNCMDNLQRLYMGSNRVQEISELEKLEGLNNLIEISLVNNPAARRHLHRPILVFKLKQMMIIDGIPVSEEERGKAELYFMDQQVVTTQPSTSESSLPGIHQIKTQVPVKVTTMHLGTSPLWNGGVLYDDSAQDAIQRGGGRRRGTGKDPTPPPNQGMMNRANTMVYNPTNTGYGGFSYTSNSVNSGARSQFYLNQIPYVQPPSQTEINQAKNNRR
ncbi:leucine-rich repeat-containing protein 9-like isoform X3 [Ostrea edulis]|uniref:leucine-rich repeat-containing protein 9-like isoform X3 n=1 Tax=Ostrea edulis TaxID=37623 RepID=UPI0024AFA474|nr:leucine-rich repeat-containing protein 9-like isoform X3 [Ostrea edulis]